MNNRKSWTKAAVGICTLVQIFHVLTMILLIVSAIHVIISPDAISSEPGEPISVNILGMDLSVTGTAIYATRGVETVPGVVFYLLFGCARAVMTFMAFGKVRNVLEYSQTQLPFCWENVERLRQSGSLFLGTVALQLVYALVSWIFAYGVLDFSINLDVDNIIVGIIVLCVSELFAQSVKMQEEIDGLV